MASKVNNFWKERKKEKLQLLGLCTIARQKTNEIEELRSEFCRILDNPYLGEDMFDEIVYSSNNIIHDLENQLPRRKVKDPLRGKLE